MFPRSKVLRAVEFKAPFLQCDSFHIMSIPEILGERERERDRGREREGERERERETERERERERSV